MGIKVDGKEGFLILVKQGAEAEARCMTKARCLGVCTPLLYTVDPVQHTLTFEYVEGLSVRDIFLNFGSNGVVEEWMVDIAVQIGDAIGKLHDGGLIHGDLTTSNMLIRNNANQLGCKVYYIHICIVFTISGDWYGGEVREVALSHFTDSFKMVVSLQYSATSISFQVLIEFGLSFTSTLPEIKQSICMYLNELCSQWFLLVGMCCVDGSNTCCIQEVLKTVFINTKQTSSRYTPPSHFLVLVFSSTLNKLAQESQLQCDKDVGSAPWSDEFLQQFFLHKDCYHPYSLLLNFLSWLGRHRIPCEGTCYRDNYSDPLANINVQEGTTAPAASLCPLAQPPPSPYFSRRSPPDVRRIADVAARFASQIQLVVVARVRGRITAFRGSVQITVSDIIVERDPNVEMLHWQDCIQLGRKCYGALNLSPHDRTDRHDLY
ncbi:protein kinase superfamily protein [Actinidia rufa]|uniref:non-specific serine/threonine protein kinase n=1 Tax=Actinidia rufa TaxID=165716 RepID=A0A7J0H9S6_9ERIC|nr:protein kinase superfamily protein [Actinidia rufa]